MAISGLKNAGGAPLRGLAELQAEIAKGRGLPPVERWNPPHCGTIDMRIARDGTWFYMGTPILRPAMVRLFSTILRREADGEFVLVTPVERVGITVEDAPFLAVTLEREGEGADQRLSFLTNVGDRVVAGPEHPIRVETDADGTPRPYVRVRGQLDALIARAPFYELVDLAVPGADPAILGVTSAGAFFPLGPAS